MAASKTDNGLEKTKKTTSSNGGKRSNTTKVKNTRTTSTQSKGRRSQSQPSNNQLTVDEWMEEKAFHDEFILVVALVVSILLLLSNFSLSGIVGEVINHFTFGLFGFIAYIIPIILFVGVAFYISNRGSRLAKKKMICGGLIVLNVMAFCQMITTEYELPIFEYYKNAAKRHTGGGLFGGIVTKILHPLFGTIGTFVILIAVLALCFMIFTGKTLVTALSKRGEESIREMHSRRKENAMLREQYEREARENPELYQKQIETNAVSKKRKAKIFTLDHKRQDTYEVDHTTGEIIGDKLNREEPYSLAEQKETPENDMDSKKEKSKRFLKHYKSETKVDMSEITPDLENLSITGSYIHKEDYIPSYEEELNEKFGNSSQSLYGQTEQIEQEIGSQVTSILNNATFSNDIGSSNHTSSVVNNTTEMKAVTRDETQSYGGANLEVKGSYEINQKEAFFNDNLSVYDQDTNQMPINESEEYRNKSIATLHGDYGSGEQKFDDISYDTSNSYGSVEDEYVNNATLDDKANLGVRGSEHDSIPKQQVNGHERMKKHSGCDSAIDGLESTNASSEQQDIDLQAELNKAMEPKPYVFPPIDLLAKPKHNVKGMTEHDLKETAAKLQKTLESFGVRVTITNISCGPAVTRYELQPEQGVKVSKITALTDDIKLNLAAADIRIEAPIPGKAAVGIEVPNKENAAVMFRELIENKAFEKHFSNIAFAVGKDIGGQVVVTDIAKMPHLLIAGATGSGKSVCINTLIMSILYKADPNDVKLIMVDPKVVELSVYNGIPHLMIPVVTDPKLASSALNWAVAEMTERYKKFSELAVRDMKSYNEKIKEVEHLNDERYKKMPQIVIIVDELADLMMVAPGEVEDAICRLAQMARAAGIHLVLATQRPSVNVITGLIKANVPSRIAFSVSSAIDSRTIIDGSGAEKLLGKGDMLFFPQGIPKPIRVQGAFISDKEVSAVVEFLSKENGEASYNHEVASQIQSAPSVGDSGMKGASSNYDEYFMQAGKFIIEKDKASIGMLQRVYKIGFNRAARIMDQLCEAGVVGPEEGTKPRKVLMSMEEFDQYLEEYV